MIQIRLKGGLGNQMFQWAFGRHLSTVLDTEIYFDLSFLQSKLQGVTKRDFELYKFPKILRSTKLIQSNFSNLQILNDSSIFTQSTLEKNVNYLLDGYFQDVRYFENSSDQIRTDLSIPSESINGLRSIYGIGRNDISMHIRRSDYLSSNGYHPILPLEYYRCSIDLIGDYGKVFIFSDDINWCKENLNFDKMVFVNTGNNVEDFYIMSLCKNNIIANSSFSWWSAWLNNNLDKKVILPKTWFGPGVSYDLENSPKEWIRI